MQKMQKMENMSQELPEELQIEIMSWLPLKSLMKFTCVSKSWAAIIHEKNFQDHHYEQSKTSLRMLFAFCREFNDPGILFHSVYQDDGILLSSGQQNMRICNGPHKISAPVRGFICLQSQDNVVICNPVMRKFRILPEVGDPSSTVLSSSFLGYDKNTNVYKVLCIATRWSYDKPFEIHQHAITLGQGEESWRSRVCKNDHLPLTTGVMEGEVLYYGAWSSITRPSGHNYMVMSFNVSSEELTVIDLHTEVALDRNSKLVNYKGTIALVAKPVIINDVIKMLVWNESSRKWLEETIVIHCWKENFKNREFSLEGFIGTEILVFGVKSLLDDGPFEVYYINKISQEVQKKFSGRVGGAYHIARTFLNHVDILSHP